METDREAVEKIEFIFNFFRLKSISGGAYRTPVRVSFGRQLQWWISVKRFLRVEVHSYTFHVNRSSGF